MTEVHKLLPSKWRQILNNNYQLFKWRLQKKDHRFLPRGSSNFKTFYNAKGKEIDTAKVLNDLLENGFAVVTDLYPDTWVNSAYKKVMRYVGDYRKKKIPESSLSQDKFGYDKNLLNTGIIRFYNVSRKIKEAGEFANNEFLKYIGELYYQKKLKLHTVISQYNQVSKIPCRGYHVDSHVEEYKTFIYLNDVNKYNGPHTYLKGSHKLTDKLVSKLFRAYTAHNTDVSDEEAQAAGFEEVAITGKKGTVLLIDTRGIHQGGTLLKGHRAVFNTYFYVGKE